jgi:anti-sigma factor RsiW
MTDPFVTYDAAYVLGALSPQDRAAFEEHLRGCTQCSAAVAELAGVPGLLGRVSAEDARGFVDPDRAPVPIPETLLPRLQHSVRQRRRRRTAWQVAGAGLIAAACLAIGLLVGNPLSAGDISGSAPPTAASSSAVPQVTVALSAGSNVPVTAQVSLQDKAWGTELKLRCAYQDQSGSYPERYALWVVGQDGARFEAAGWKTAAGVPVMNITGATSLTREQIASIEVVDDQGAVLLTGTPG